MRKVSSSFYLFNHKIIDYTIFQGALFELQRKEVNEGEITWIQGQIMKLEQSKSALEHDVFLFGPYVPAMRELEDKMRELKELREFGDQQLSMESISIVSAMVSIHIIV